MQFIKSIFFFFLLSSCMLVAMSQDIPQRPNPPKLVNDYTNTLTADQQIALEKKLVAFEDSTSTQIAVVIVPSLNDYDIGDFALKLGREWGVGGKDYNNGVVFLISTGDHKINISTGYGVEGALPDITAKHIIEDVVSPNFKGNDYYRGIDEGTNTIIKAVKGEYKAPRKKDKGTSSGKILMLVILVILFLSLTSRGGGGGSTISRRGLGGAMFFPMGGGFGGSGGNSGGGGFGGFGGGSFGGGGASGGW